MVNELAQALFDHIPVGVGSQGIIPTTMADLEAALEMGVDYSVREVGFKYSSQFICLLLASMQSVQMIAV